MPRLIIKSEGEELAVESFNLKLGVNKLGRTLDNDIRINHPGVSTSHCEIRWLNDEVIVRDLNSTNGTFVNGQRIAESHLTPGQILRVGDVEMFLDTAQAAISVPDLKEPDRGPAPNRRRAPCRAKIILPPLRPTAVPNARRIFAKAACAR